MAFKPYNMAKQMTSHGAKNSQLRGVPICCMTCSLALTLAIGIEALGPLGKAVSRMSRATGLDEGVQVHSGDRELLDVVVRRVLRGIPDQPQEQAVEEVIASQAGDAHVEEHALKHGTRQELQHRRQEECTAYEQVDKEVGGTLLHHFGRDLVLALGQLLHLVRGQRNHVGDAGHRRGHRQGQAQHGANGQRECSTHKKIKMITGALLQVVGRAVHDHGGEVLVQVAQHSEAHGLRYSKQPFRQYQIGIPSQHYATSMRTISHRAGAN